MTRTNRPFAALAAAETASLTGTRLSMIAVPWLVLTTTGDPVMTGITAFAEMLPYVVAKALGGPLIDRLGPRRIAIAGDLGALVAVGAIPLLHLAGWLAMPTLLPLVFVMGLLRGPADGAKQSLVPLVAEKGQLPLERVTGVLGMIDRLATTLGAAAGGALVALIGPAPALGVNALAFGTSALLIAAGIPRKPPAATEPPTKTAYLKEFTEGWRFLRTDAVLIGMTVMIAGAPRFFVFAPDAPFAAILALISLAGFASGFLNPIISALVFERIPAALMGRVSALFSALSWVLMPFGGLAGGILIATIGLSNTFLLLGLGYLGATMLPLLRKSFRAFSLRPGDQGEAA